MLTADLIRVSRRRGRIHPRYVDTANPKLLETARALIDVFVEAAGADPPWQREAIDERIADLVEHRADPLLFRGLCKLLTDRSTFEQVAATDPEALRRTLFEAAARVELRREPGRPWAEKRQTIVSEMAAELGLTPQQVESSLFADLPDSQRLVDFKVLDAPALLERYNLALAQAVLIRATRLAVRLAPAPVGAYRQLFRALKFHQLIHTVLAGPDGGYFIEVDGPLSLFASSTRYGVAMAQFLPSLALLDEWALEAELLWGAERQPATFSVDHTRGLKSHRKARGQYVTREQEWLEERLAKKPGPWSWSRSTEILQTQRGEVIVPDLQFEHGADGRVAHLEIIGYWRRGSLDARLAQLDDPRLDGLLLAVSSNLAGDEGAETPEHPRVIWFKQVISSSRVRQALDRVAVG